MPPRKVPKNSKKLKPYEKIIVNSRSYGQHERAARGSVTYAELNESMQEHGKRARASNEPAGLIHNALKPYRSNFTGGLFWQEMLKCFSKQSKAGKQYSILPLLNKDLNKNYPAGRMLISMFEIHFDAQTSTLEMSYGHEPSEAYLKKASFVDGFQITIIGMFPDFEKNEIVTHAIVLPHRSARDKSIHHFLMNVPLDAKSCLLCTKIEATHKGEVHPGAHNPSRGMYFNAAMEFD